jgi:hypothetical protein
MFPSPAANRHRKFPSPAANRRQNSNAELMDLQQQVLEKELENQESFSQIFVKMEEFLKEGTEAFKKISQHFSP